MKRRRILRYLTGVTVALALAAIFAAVAGAWDSGDKAPGTGQQTLTWTGNGWPAQQRCTPADPGNVGYQNGSSASDYMLWILNTDGGSITGGWSLTVGGTTYNTTDDHQLVTPFVDPTGAVANVDVASTGGGSWVLTLSHGCSGKTTPDISTVASSTGEGQVGDTLNDTATLAGGNNPTGKITFTAYGPDDEFCSTSVYSEDVTVNGNGDYSTATGYVVPAKGDYQWIASYSGDANNDPVSTQCGDPDETLTFEAAAPDVETAIHLEPETSPPTVVGGATHVALGSTVHDSATVSAPAVLGTPTGSVDFSFYSGTCGDPENATLVGTDTVDLVNGVADPSKSHGPLGAGSYFYLATYHSDNTDVWQNSDSLCEPLTVDKAQLTIVTQIHDAGHNDVGGATHVPLGSVVHDTATVTGQVPGFSIGTISFTLNGDPVGQIYPPEAGYTATTVDSAPLVSGSYVYAASVADNDNYIGGVSGDEPLTVRTYGKTMGFWGNTNGQALLPSNPGVTLGIVPPSATNTSTCWVVVNTKAKSLTILPNTLNGMSILTNCTTSSKLDSGINGNSMNTLLAQTLALEFNILYKGSYAGQTIGGMGLTGFIPTAFPTGKSLTATNTVEDVFAYANYLIGQAKSGGVPPNTVTITQSMIGQLNTLLGKLNAES